MQRLDLVQRSSLLCALVLLLQTGNGLAQTAPPPSEPLLQESEMVKLPTGVLLIKGAEASASDSVTPLPESGRVVKDVYQNPYFGLAYPLPSDWSENFSGPPPSDSGHYVLTLLGPSPKYKGPNKATLLIQAHDLFFSLASAANAMELMAFAKETLPPLYEIERNPETVRIANRNFIRFEYKAEAAGLHWVTLTTEIRCHAVQFVFTSSDAELLQRLVKEMDHMQLPPEASTGSSDSTTPICIAGYGDGSNVTNRVDPVMTGSQKFNPIPVRIIIDKRGRVRHVHMINAFPEQAASIQDALLRWTFKPREVNGQRVEVETGIRFGYSPPWPKRENGSAEAPADQ